MCRHEHYTVELRGMWTWRRSVDRPQHAQRMADGRAQESVRLLGESHDRAAELTPPVAVSSYLGGREPKIGAMWVWRWKRAAIGMPLCGSGLALEQKRDPDQAATTRSASYSSCNPTPVPCMAYRDFDDRPRYSSRRYEPNTSRSRDYEQVKGQNYPYDRRRTEYYAYDQRRTADYDDRYADDYTRAYAYDDLRGRDRYPPTPPPTASYRIERRRRASWPPCPTVEDIEVALAKEAGHAPSADGKRGDEAPNRGCIDQEPIMVEVEDEMARFNQERRFVLVPGNGDGAEKSPDDVRARRSMRQHAGRQRAPPLQTDLRDPPVNTTRSRSPYSYSRASATHKERNSGDSYLSPESAASSTSFGRASGARSDANGRTDPAKSRPAPLQTQSLFPTDSRRDNVVSDGSDMSADESQKLRERRKPARYSFTPADLKKDDLRTSLHDLTSPPDRVSSPYSYAPVDLRKDDLRTPLSASVPARDRVSSPYTFTPMETKKDSIKHPALDSEPIRERVSSPYSFNPADRSPVRTSNYTSYFDSSLNAKKLRIIFWGYSLIFSISSQ
ncbi:hypothetical protein GTA08_BOTSDO07651 [Botryosphaeria dothidea]|uniref:Uncharacterized protein n=1 Tax=Botryosphaeria dothidea TaxID=55169 RepID=A0A8H4N2U1_9PEZI|nr:hypothetical protein GTA08_BOTSDO07651 [Botryosphaeria dothidea]